MQIIKSKNIIIVEMTDMNKSKENNKELIEKN